MHAVRSDKHRSYLASLASCNFFYNKFTLYLLYECVWKGLWTGHFKKIIRVVLASLKKRFLENESFARWRRSHRKLVNLWKTTLCQKTYQKNKPFGSLSGKLHPSALIICSLGSSLQLHGGDYSPLKHWLMFAESDTYSTILALEHQIYLINKTLKWTMFST